MTLLDEVAKIHLPKVNTQAERLLKVLSKKNPVIALTAQENGHKLYVKLGGTGYYNMYELTPILYNQFDLVVNAFDSDERVFWLSTKEWMAKQ